MASARIDPLTTLRTVEELRAAESASPMLITALRAGGLAARAVGKLDQSDMYFGEALETARTLGDGEAATEVLLSIAGNRFLSGDPTGAVAELDLLDTDDDALRAKIEAQAAMILARSGRPASALPRLDRALQAFERVGDDESAAFTLNNRGLIRLQMGDHVRARSDLEASYLVQERLGLDLEVAYALHNLGQVEARSGNMPLAFQRFSDAEEIIRRLVDSDWEVKAGHCRALLASGLLGEAERLAASGAEALAAAGLPIEAAEALAIRAEALAAAGRRNAAIETAHEAAQAFRSQDRAGYAAAVDLVRLRLADDPDAADEADEIVEELERHGMADAALRARILAADLRSAIDAERSVIDLERLRPAADGAAFDARLDHAAARATALRRAGRRRAAAAAAHAGAELLESYQALVGLSDVRLTLQSSADRLHDVGLACSIDTRDNRRCFDWIERRALGASVVRQPEPVADPDLRSLLTELSALEGDAPPGRRADLERDIRTIARTSAPHVVPERCGAAEVLGALEHRTMVTLAATGDRLFGLRLREGRVHRFELGSLAATTAYVADARRALTRAAMSPEWDGAARVAERLRRIDDAVLAPMRLDEQPLVIVAPAALAELPWSGLPSRLGRPTVVTRSASSWLSARTDDVRHDGRLVVIDGPDLIHADHEAGAIGDAIDGSTRLPSDLDIDGVLAALEGSSTFHAVSHGDLRTDNPLFSSLRLHSGDLFAYHIQRLARPPAVAVLSACYLALGTDSAGTRLLGFTDALLAAGTSSVIASTLPVPDSEPTVVLMTALHRDLAGGVDPSTALARSLDVVEPERRMLYGAAFGCFGAG